jgi:hypothetical protein
MTNQHPITPPEELVEQWVEKANREIGTIAYNPRETFHYGATQGARWGADQELEACCQYINEARWFGNPTHRTEPLVELRAARRPQPPTLKEQALVKLAELEGKLGNDFPRTIASLRRILEQLPND